MKKETWKTVIQIIVSILSALISPRPQSLTQEVADFFILPQIRQRLVLYALLNFVFGCLQRGQRQSSGRSSKATPSCSAGS